MDLKQRTKQFSLRILHLADSIPNKTSGYVIAKQIVRSGTSVGANYRAACRAKSPADFIYKLTVIEEECDETMYWLELLNESHLLIPDIVTPIHEEANELTAIIVASIRTAKKNLRS